MNTVQTQIVIFALKRAEKRAQALGCSIAALPWTVLKLNIKAKYIATRTTMKGECNAKKD